MAKSRCNPPVLFCKSFSPDILRVKNLFESIQKYNTDKLCTYISVPANELDLFKNVLGTDYCIFLADDEILSRSPRITAEKLASTPGRLLQQVIKAEFWRLSPSDVYVCLDSDSFFIRDFSMRDFIADCGAPYSVLHQCKDYLQTALNARHSKVYDDYHRDSNFARTIFDRRGPNYDFGPTPVIWSSLVWEALDKNYLQPRGLTFLDAIKIFPSELRWYGESLLSYLPFPLCPVEPLFRVYHSSWQYNILKQQGESAELASKNYLGIVMQSNWSQRSSNSNPLMSKVSTLIRKLF